MKVGLELSFELGSLPTLYFENIINRYQLFEPHAFSMDVKTYAWNEKKFKKALSKYEGNVHSGVYDLNRNIISFGRTGTRSPHMSINIELDSSVFSPSNADIEALINHPGFVAAYLFDEEYTYIQSEEFENNLIGRKNLSYHNLETIRHTPFRIGVHGTREYDTRYNPGRKLLIGHTWLVPAYKMWFGKPFFNLVPKERITSFPHAVTIEEVMPDILHVQLFDKIEESHTKDSMFRQAKWSEWLDFDGLKEQYP